MPEEESVCNLNLLNPCLCSPGAAVQRGAGLGPGGVSG